jgi:hypothetical protein
MTGLIAVTEVMTGAAVITLIVIEVEVMTKEVPKVSEEDKSDRGDRALRRSWLPKASASMTD